MTPSEPSATEHADVRFWDRTARGYARSPIADPEGYERTLECVSTLLLPEHQVLELGCGTGTTALRLVGGVRRYDATDLSPEMVAIATEKLTAEPVAGLTFAAATAATVVPPDGGYDAVLGFNYLHLVPDLAQTLATIHGLVRPGGLFVSKTACVGELNVFIRWAIPAMRWIGKAPRNVGVFDEPVLVDAIRAAGFQVEAVERHGVKGKDVRAFVLARRSAQPLP